MLCSICVATITGLPARLAAADQVLLDDRHLRHVHLHAQVAAGDHQAVAGVDDRVDFSQRLGFLDLGDQVDVAATLFARCSRSSCRSSALRTNDRAQVIQIVLDRPVDAFPIAIGDRRHVDGRVRAG